MITFCCVSSDCNSVSREGSVSGNSVLSNYSVCCSVSSDYSDLVIAVFPISSAFSGDGSVCG